MRAELTKSLTCFIAIGANLGDSQAAVRQAMQDIAHLPESQLVCSSSLYRTAPVDSSGPDYVNAVVEISTRLSPHALLAQLQRLEALAQRVRPYRNAPRTLDLDILLCSIEEDGGDGGSVIIDTPQLQVPHPRMMQRAFVLVPLAEIAPHRVNPAQLTAVSGQAIARMGDAGG